MTVLCALVAVGALAGWAWEWHVAQTEVCAADYWRTKCAELGCTVEEQAVTIAQLYGQVSRQARTFVLSRGGSYKGES